MVTAQKNQLNALIADLTAQRAKIEDSLVSLNMRLAASPRSGKHAISKSIKNLEDQEKALDKRIKDAQNDLRRIDLVTERMDYKKDAVEHGIDPNAAIADAVKSGLGSVANITASLTGGNALGMLSKKNALASPDGTVSANPPATTNDSLKQNSNLIMLVVAVVAVIFLIFKK
jgi:hypothetical protein